jgi:hypothetical protein
MGNEDNDGEGMEKEYQIKKRYRGMKRTEESKK